MKIGLVSRLLSAPEEMFANEIPVPVAVSGCSGMIGLFRCVSLAFIYFKVSDLELNIFVEQMCSRRMRHPLETGVIGMPEVPQARPLHVILLDEQLCSCLYLLQVIIRGPSDMGGCGNLEVGSML